MSSFRNKLYNALWKKSLSDIIEFPRWTTIEKLPCTLDFSVIIHKILHRAFKHYGECWGDYLEYIPFNNPTIGLLNKFKNIEYSIGTSRPDFLFNHSGFPLICEINARFPLNLFLFSLHAIAVTGGTIPAQSPALRTLEKIEDQFGKLEELAVLTGSEPMFDSAILLKAAELSNLSIKTLTISDLENQNTDKYIIINELTQNEILSLSEKALDKLIFGRVLNDLRTVFLIHDKRFLSLLSNNLFLKNAGLNETDQELLKKSIISTTPINLKKHYEFLLRNRTSLVIKHSMLGKSQDIAIGPMCSDVEWNCAVASSKDGSRVFQPFIPQKKFKVLIGGRFIEVFLLGGFLSFNDEFLGTSVFRVIKDFKTDGCWFIPPVITQSFLPGKGH